MEWFIVNAGQLLLCIIIFVSLTIMVLSVGIPLLLGILVAREIRADKKKRRSNND